MRVQYIWLILTVVSSSSGFLFGPSRHDPDIDRNVSQLIASKGYPVEDHWVRTTDDYIIGIQRIPHGRSGTQRFPRERIAVFLMHGILETSADWVINMPHQSLGFILADHGFDVWLGNARGNDYTRHVNIPRSSPKFWEFSFSEFGEKDVAASLSYIHTTVKPDEVYYVGFSLGASTVLSLLSEKPQYNNLVKKMVLIAPAMFFHHMHSSMRHIAPFVSRALHSSGIDTYPFFHNSDTTREFSRFVCGNPVTRFKCQALLELLQGPQNSNQMNLTRLPVYMAHSPSGISLRLLDHCIQMGTKKVFTKFDFGPRKNLEVYGRDTPPVYNLSNVRVPTAIIYSNHDQLVAPEDVLSLSEQLLTVFDTYVVNYPYWSHLDMMLAVEAYKYVYPKVLEYLLYGLYD